MTQLSIAELSATAGGPAKHVAESLPDRSRAGDVASFERLMQQAQEAQAQVEFVNPADSLAKASVDGAVAHIGEASGKFRHHANESIAAMNRLDMADPASWRQLFQNISASAMSGAQLAIIMGEVSSTKKSIQELYHNQG